MGSLTEDELDQLMTALRRSGRPYTDADIELLVNWMAEIRLSASLLGFVLHGRLACFVEDGKVMVGDNAAQEGD